MVRFTPGNRPRHRVEWTPATSLPGDPLSLTDDLQDKLEVASEVASEFGEWAGSVSTSSIPAMTGGLRMISTCCLRGVLLRAPGRRSFSGVREKLRRRSFRGGVSESVAAHTKKNTALQRRTYTAVVRRVQTHEFEPMWRLEPSGEFVMYSGMTDTPLSSERFSFRC